MGKRKKHAPRHGSLAFWPHKRAKRQSARWRHWSKIADEPCLLGFAGYKAGMTHAACIEDKKRSYYYKQEQITPVTVIETPPIIAVGIRLYGQVSTGQFVLGEVWIDQFDSDLTRKLKCIPKDTEVYDPWKIKETTEKKSFEKTEELIEKIDKLREKLESAIEVRLLAHTLPRQAGFSRKTPDILEIKIGAPDVPKGFDFAVSKLGNEITIRDVFKEGEHIDVTSVTKGKGFSGPVKRFNIKILPRKTRKGRRVVGCIGPWHPARVMWTVPRAGHHGNFSRTEYNKRILKLGRDGEEITPTSGFKRYGRVKGEHVILKGSVPGSAKRLIRLRRAIRHSPISQEPPVITFINKGSQI
ncbi:MAG: 50S ribosomal protein L3 [Promethearchaeota archaeon]